MGWGGGGVNGWTDEQTRTNLPFLGGGLVQAGWGWNKRIFLL